MDNKNTSTIQGRYYGGNQEQGNNCSDPNSKEGSYLSSNASTDNQSKQGFGINEQEQSGPVQPPQQNVQVTQYVTFTQSDSEGGFYNKTEKQNNSSKSSGNNNNEVKPCSPTSDQETRPKAVSLQEQLTLCKNCQTNKQLERKDTR